MGERPREGFSQESVAAVFPGARVDPKSIAATAMRGDFDASILSGYRNRVGGKDRIQLEIVIATYNGFTVTQVTTKLSIAQGTVTRVLNRFNDRGIDWLLGLLKRNGRPSTLDQSELYKVALREDWDAQAVRNAMSRAVDERHRAELEVVHQLYEQSGNAEIVGKLMKMQPRRSIKLAPPSTFTVKHLGSKVVRPECFHRSTTVRSCHNQIILSSIFRQSCK